MTVCHMHDGDFSPIEHEVTQPCSQENGGTDPEIECHESEHQTVAENHLCHMKTRLDQMRDGEDSWIDRVLRRSWSAKSDFGGADESV